MAVKYRAFSHSSIGISEIDDELIKISNSSLRLSSQNIPIRCSLTWKLDHIQHPQTVSLTAGQTESIHKSDWRQLETYNRITNNLKLLIQAQGLSKEFSLGFSKNISELKSISVKKHDHGIIISLQISDMNNVEDTKEQYFKLDENESPQEFSDRINAGIEQIPGFVEYFTDSIVELEVDSSKYENYLKILTFTTNYQYIRSGYSGDMKIRVNQQYQPTFHQEQIQTIKFKDELVFSLVNNKKNGGKEKLEDRINLSYETIDEVNYAVEEFNKNSEYVIIDKPKNDIAKFAVHISEKNRREKYAFEIDFLRKITLNGSPDYGFIPHITLLKSELMAENITNAELIYFDDEIYPKILRFTFLARNPFTTGDSETKTWSIPNSPDKDLSVLTDFLKKNGVNSYRKTIGRQTKTGWIAYEVYRNKTSFENTCNGIKVKSPLIPLKLDPIIKLHTGKITGRNYFFDVFNCKVGVLIKKREI